MIDIDSMIRVLAPKMGMKNCTSQKCDKNQNKLSLLPERRLEKKDVETCKG